jgi:uncharacterized protein (DUF4415 family)
MSRPPFRSTSRDPRSLAEAAFKSTKPEPPPLPAAKPALPSVREMVTLRIDQDILAHFQEGGPGWQDRINDALRTLVAK